VPFISGKDSLYNEFRTESGESLPIPPTLLISAVGVIPDATQTTTSDFKATDSIIYIVGETFEELGGSEYFRVNQGLGREVPRVNPGIGRQMMTRVGRAIRSGLVRACHDLSEGGLGIALAEMAFGGRTGARITLRKVPGAHRFHRDDFLLFAESNSRFLCEVPARSRSAFEHTLGRVPCTAIGRSTESTDLVVVGLKGDTVVQLGLAEAENAWRRALSKKL
jgi:phosphoribosylformylglycinamidine synthase